MDKKIANKNVCSGYKYKVAFAYFLQFVSNLIPIKKFRKQFRKHFKSKTMGYSLLDFNKIPKIMSYKDTLNYIIENRCSIIRFGDGEIGYLLDKNFQHFFQPYNERLQNRLKQVLSNPINSCLCCLPEWIAAPPKNDFQYMCQCKYNHKFINYIKDIEYYYGSSFCFATSSFRENNINLMRQIWNDRDVVIVTGQNSTFINDDRLFGNAKSIKFLYSKGVDAFSEYDELIKNITTNVDKDTLVLISLGITATVLAYDLSLLGYQAIDMGHITNYYLSSIGEMPHIEFLRNSGKFADGKSDIQQLYSKYKNVQSPLVSVIIPAYNHENYVQESIKSIIRQTYQNIELIVIDDGSKDLTWEKIQELKVECEKRFVRVHFETKENEGSCKTLNKLLSLALGEYVYIIASDDLAKPSAVEKEVRFLERHKGYALCVGNNEIIDSDGKVCYWDKERNNVYSKKEAKFLTFVDFLQGPKCRDFKSEKFGTYESLYFGNYIPNGYMVRKSIMDKIGEFTLEAPLEDYWMMLQVSKYGKMKYLDEVLFSYRWHGTNQMKNLERIIALGEKTKEYEQKILENFDDKDVIIDIQKIRTEGVLYKKQGIPFVFEILTYNKLNYRVKVVKLLNNKIHRYTKSI